MTNLRTIRLRARLCLARRLPHRKRHRRISPRPGCGLPSDFPSGLVSRACTRARAGWRSPDASAKVLGTNLALRRSITDKPRKR